MLDVTDPENPAYCFVGQPYVMRERNPEYEDAPLDAHSYLSLYYNLNEGQPLEDEVNMDMNGEPDHIPRERYLLTVLSWKRNVNGGKVCSTP